MDAKHVMVSVRSAKAKGSALEYDCQHSLKKLFPDIYRTSERGFQLQYDLQSDEGRIVVECKRLKGMSWNQAKKFFFKVRDKAPDSYTPFLLFQSNRQPCLVMCWDHFKGTTVVMEFEAFFETPFEKHPSTRSSDK